MSESDEDQETSVDTIVDDEDTGGDQQEPAVSDSEALTEHPEGDRMGDTDPGDSDETFSRTYVEKLRRESARYRERAQQADTLAERLHVELVRATGRLADPTDLSFDEVHLQDPESLAAAIDDLVERKPHLASRRPIGEIGQGTVSSGSNVDLAGLLRSRAN